MSGWKMVEEQEERDDSKVLEVLHISNYGLKWGVE